MKLETLYKRTKTGAIQYWEISVEKGPDFDLNSDSGDTVPVSLPDSWNIVKKSGQLGTSLPIRYVEPITIGKNTGRSNETTPREQAESQAQSDWKKKRDDGYKSLEDLRIVDSNPSGNPHRYSTNTSHISDNLSEILELALPQFNTDASGNVKPMLATDWKKIKKINYPVLVQPKLDGVRCLMLVNYATDLDKVVTFLSRSGKEYTTLDHIAHGLTDVEDRMPINFILDGEIYSDELTFQEIIQAVKKQYPNSLKLHFRAYDVISESSQEDRVITEVRNLVHNILSSHITYVDNHWCNNREEVKALHDRFVQEGFEGAMIRIPDGKYEQGCRSRSLLKVKEFDEGEFTMLELQLGQREEDLLVLCKTDAGKEFRAKMIGTKQDKKVLTIAHGINKFIGNRKLTVKHFGWTSDGLPRFPIGKAIRDYEE